MIRVLISFRVAVLTLLAVFVFTGAAWAQNAGLSGAVLDASGRVFLLQGAFESVRPEFTSG